MRSNPNCNGNRRDKVALKTTRVKNVKFNIVKRSTGCQYAGYFYESKNLYWAVQNPPLGRGLVIAEQDLHHNLNEYHIMFFSDLLNMNRKSVEHITE